MTIILDDLLAFLHARLDEDEQRTRKLMRSAQVTALTLQDPKLLGKYVPGWHDWPDVERMCEARLREIEAKRRIIDLHVPVVDDTQSTWAWFEGSESKSMAELCILAAIYADHPDYRQEWAP